MEFVPSLPIPSEGVLTLTVPSGITVPSSVNLQFVCSAGCKQNGSLTYSANTGTIQIKNAFQNSYLQGGTTIRFTLTGFTNPTDTAVRTFTLMT